MSERTFDRTAVIALEPGPVFGFIADPGRAPAWEDQILRVEPLDEGPVRAGWRYRETRRMGKREAAAVITVTAYRPSGPPFEIEHGSDAMGVSARYRFTVDRADGGGTRIDLHASVTGRGVLGRLLWSRIIFAAMKKADGALLERLKAHLESGEADLPDGPLTH